MLKRLHIYLLSSVFYLLSISPIHAWEGDQGDVATLTSITSLFANILGNVLRLIGLSTFIMIIVGGFKYLTAGGDPKATEAAQATITSGVIGLVLAIAAWFVLLAVEGFTGVSVTQFNLNIIPSPN